MKITSRPAPAPSHLHRLFELFREAGLHVKVPIRGFEIVATTDGAQVIAFDLNNRTIDTFTLKD